MNDKNNSNFRLPMWLGDGSHRWRMRIGYHFGKDGRRVEKPFYWPGSDDNGGVPPPDVQAGAVEHQRRWRQLKRDWKELSHSLKVCFPERDWSMPVWCDEEQTKMKAGEAAGIAQAMEAYRSEEEAAEHREQQQAVLWIIRRGLDEVLDALRRPPEPPEFHHSVTSVEKQHVLQRIEDRRITTLAELAPTVERKLLSSTTVRKAIEAYLADLATRVALETSLGIDKTTSDTESRRLYGAFGLSANLKNPPLRDTPIKIDDPLLSLDRERLKKFAMHWHEMPEGINSERTVKNYLNAVRQFLIWCEEQEKYGFHLHIASRRLLTAGAPEREAVDFEPDNIRKLVIAAGRRGQCYMLFGLCFGYYPQDIAETLDNDLFCLDSIRYVQRFRSKEKRRKKGRRPLKVRHYIPPEVAALIDAERGTNSLGTLFNTEHGTILTAASIHDRWQDIQERAGVDLMFSQLRKIGFNAMKRLGNNEGTQMADFWDGHAKGSTDPYDDGIWRAMNEVERLWANELREHKIIT
jgi:hypothetical protein